MNTDRKNIKASLRVFTAEAVITTDLLCGTSLPTKLERVAYLDQNIKGLARKSLDSRARYVLFEIPNLLKFRGFPRMHTDFLSCTTSDGDLKLNRLSGVV